MPLTHVDNQGHARMVDVTQKADTHRIAVARGEILMQPETLRLVAQNQIAKGDVLTVAQIAGIMAAKQTSQIIPMCHPLMLTDIDVRLTLNDSEHKVEIAARVSTTGKTGVEMEALTAVTVAALTVYDMCKAVDRGMRIEDVRLVRKSGGQSGDIILES
jgi:cyclic pyranopterin phosphate synthase